MVTTDPIADMLTRVRNANMPSHEKVDIPFSKEKLAIVKILKEEGFILNYKEIEEGTFSLEFVMRISRNMKLFLSLTQT